MQRNSTAASAGHPGQVTQREAQRAGTSRMFTLSPLVQALAVALAAGGVMGNVQAQQAFSSGWFAGKGAAQSNAAATGRLPNGMPVSSLGAANAAQSAQQANAQRSLANLNAAAQTIAAEQAAQAAARQAALDAASTIPDGLAVGGLKVDTNSLTAGWLNANAPVQAVAGGKVEVKVVQTAEKAILNWETFNVGRNTVVNFDQKAGTQSSGTNNWIALNRVNDPSGKPSEIAGQIKADGSVYIVNRNGIIFNGSSQVDTRGLIASSLALSDRQFQRGINNPESKSHVWAGEAWMPIFGDHSTTGPTFLEADDWAPTLPVPGHVVINAGASLNVNAGGKLMLFGTQVRNAGALNVKDGQIILAAGEQVWLGEDVSGVRGLDVAVSGPMPSLMLQSNLVWIMSKPNWQSSFLEFDTRMRDVAFPALDARAALLGYQVTNTGSINAERGNVTLQSREVNQEGVLTATTALNNRDGSIRLRAWGQGGVFYTTNAAETYGNFALQWSAGNLTLGKGSLALVMPDVGDTSSIEATDLATRYTPGSITLHGKLVNLQSGSSVMAPSGIINIISAANPFVGTGGSGPAVEPGFGQNVRDGSRIYLDTDAVVSVAGLQDVAVALSRNFIEADFRINELRDSPLLRDSWLRGKKLVVDRRESGVFADGPMAGVVWGGATGAWSGTPLADVSAWLGVGKTDLQELSTTGGKINMKAGGSLVTRQGSLIDISGGSIRYEGGLNTSSKLMGADGRVYTMADASAGMQYTGIAGKYDAEHARWGVAETFTSSLIGGAYYEAGYVEGRNAGGLVMYVSNGTVLEGDIAGSVVAGDRQRTTSSAAKAGYWQFGGGGNPERSWVLGKLVISSNTERVDDAFTAGSVLDGRFVRATPLDTTTWIDDSLLERSGLGKISLFVGKGFTLEEGTQLDLSPRTAFTVEASASTGLGLDFLINGTIRSAGGSITLGNNHVDGGSIVLGDKSRLDVAGQWVNEIADGVGSGAPALKGGSISLGSMRVGVDGEASLVVSGGARAWIDKGRQRVDAGDAGSIQLSGFRGEDINKLDLQAYSAGSGGQLNILSDGAVRVGDAQAAGQAEVPSSAVVLPSDLYGSRGFRSVMVETRGNIDIADGARVSLVPLGWDLSLLDYPALASGSNLADVLVPGLLRPEQRIRNAPASVTLKSSGASLRVGNGATLQVDTAGSVVLTGTDVVVDGTIDAPAGSISLAGTTATLGESARVLARGANVLYADARGLATGTVLDGGSVSIKARDLLLNANSVVDVSGTSGIIDVRTGSLARTAVIQQTVASNGGSIEIAGQGLMASTLVGHAGGAGARGGSLLLQHVSPPGGGSLTDSLVQYMCGAVGFCTPESIIGVDFSEVMAEYGVPGLPSMIITQAVFDGLGSASRVGLSVSDSATPGSAPGQPINYAALGMSDEVLDLFRDQVYFDFRALTPSNTLLAARPAGFSRGGFARLSLAGSSVEIGDVNLSATQSIDINGALRRAAGEPGHASLTAPYLLLRQSASSGAPGAAAERSGQLALNAKVVEVQGGVSTEGAIYGPAAIRGFAQTTLTADELRFSVVSYKADLSYTPTAADATLSVDGPLTVAAGLVYPSTAVKGRITSGESITILGNGRDPGAPLSAGGSLTLSAPVIEHHGVLRAPFGQITLEASERLVLGAGSLLSVSGAGLLVPYGTLLNNEYWAAPFSSTEGTGISMLPEKRITLNAPVVDSAAGSVIDIRGGGDLHAKEFVPGTGGSHDVLALPGAYAVIPGHASPVALGANGGTAGSSLWLAGGNGLAAGWYTLMPASYAALPGAWLVMPSAASPGFSTIAGTAALTDGSAVMAGRRGNALDGSNDARTSYWRVMSSTQARQYSEYNESKASSFFASDAFKLSQYRLTGVNVVTPRLPGDGGSVVFKATERLVLDGQLLSRAEGEGRGGLVDISGRKIAIVGAGQETADLTAAGYLIIDSAKLSGFGADSVLIGGVRSGHALGLGVEVSASDIVVRNSASTALTGSEIILAASDRVQVDAGGVVTAQGTGAKSAGDLVMVQQQKAVWRTDDAGTWWDPGDDITVLVTPASDWGALLRVSTGPAVKVMRQDVDITRGGLVSIGENAVLSGGSALLIDATRSTLLAASAQLSGSALSVASSRIGFGGGDEGLVLGSATLAQLAQTQELTLRSYSSIDFRSDVNFSGSGLQAVVLDAARLAGYEGNVTVQAGKLTLANSGAQAAAGAALGGGTLGLHADELVLGAGAKAVEGFAAVELQGRQRIVAAGNGSLDTGSAQLGLDTPVLTGIMGASHAITTRGALTLAGSAGAPVQDAQDSLGTAISLTGGSVDVRGRIVALGGTVSLTALTGDLRLADGSLIDTSGFSRAFYDVFAYANAGRIQLSAEHGDIRQDAGASLDLSAHAGGGSAGVLTVKTTGTGVIDLQGRLSAHGGAGEGSKGGSFMLDVGELPGFSALGQRLNEAGFSAARSFRVRNGDVTVDGTTVVEDFSLSADRGAVTLSGTIDARSTYGGRIAIAGGNGVAVTGSAMLRAGATDETLGSGRVILEATGGQLDLRGGTIDVAGGEGGRVRLRAMQTAGHDGIAVAALASAITGARSAVLEGVAVYEGVSSIDAVKAAAIADANTFAGHAGAIATRLGNSTVAVMPGIEIRSNGDLTLATDWNLQTGLGAGMREGSLTLRAAGNLIINANLSDGFDAAGREGVLQSTASWDLRLVSGADLSSGSAAALQTPGALAQDKGSLVIGDAAQGYLVRTGTGDLEVNAARDLKLAHETSVIYTAGRKDTTVWSDFNTTPGRLILGTSYPQTISFSELPTAAYGVQGGNLRVNAQGDVSSSLSADGKAQFFNEWLLRLGREERQAESQGVVSVDMPFMPGEQSTWFVDYAKFNQGVGALGGGNVSVNAGGNINDLLVALPTNGRVRGGRTPGEAKTLELRNGGAMSVTADGDIRGGQYYVGRGDGKLVANALSASAREPATPPVLALGDATLGVTTRGDLRVATVADPLLTFIPYLNNAQQFIGAYMTGYTDNSALSLVSLGGDVVLGAPELLAGRIPNSGAFSGQDIYPSKLRVTALSGSVSNEQGSYSYQQGDHYSYNVDRSGLLFVMPSAQTDLQLLAEKDVRLGMVAMSRLPPDAMPNPLNPMRDFTSFLRTWFFNNQQQSFGYPANANTSSDWLLADHTPSRIYSRTGSIVREVPGEVFAGEQMWLRAGQDIRGLRVNFRNNHRDDVSLVEASNDVNGMTPARLAGLNLDSYIEIQGPGSLLVSAGRDVYNVNAVSVGNIQRWDTNNFPEASSRVNHLPDEGASINVMAGMNGQQADYAAFAAAYLDPAKVAAMPAHLVTTLADGSKVPRYLLDAQEPRTGGETKTVQRGLASFVAEISGDVAALIDPLQAWSRFQAMPQLTQQVFMRRVFLQELREAGRNQNEPGVGGLPLNGGYNRGYAAIASLFPGDAWKGDVVADSMTLRTMLGGDVNVFAPGGKFQAAALTRAPAAGEGVVTLAGGHVGIFVNDSVEVNRSRVLTFVPEAAERGNDMIIWSTRGDVDAGRGAKTVRVPSKPVVKTDLDGNTVVKERSDMSGSGIGTVGSGDVDLVAPLGTINAGDAGIRVAGNLNLAALHVVNVDNIEVEGETMGMPVVAAVNVAALTNASAATAQASAAAQDVLQRERAAARQALPSVFTVRVLGFGNEVPEGAPAAPAPGGASRPAAYNPQGVVQVIGAGALNASELQALTPAERRNLIR